MVNSPFDIMQPHSYEEFLVISGITENETKGALRAVGAWALSVTAAAVAPGQSSMRNARAQIGKSAQEQLEMLKKASPSDNLVNIIDSKKETLQKLSILKQNLQTHNKVITQYNQRFVFKEGIAACRKHEGILQEIEQHEKLVQENLNQHCMQYGREIEDRLMDQILGGMPVDRAFVQYFYQDIIERYDVMPPKNREKALNDLHFLLNRVYINGLKQKLNDDFRSVIPKTMEKLFAKMGLSKYFEAENAKKAVEEMSQELTKQMNREDIETLSLPECIEFVNGKFMAYAASVIKANTPNEKSLIGAVDLLHTLHQMELNATSQWRSIASIFTDEQIRKIAMDVYVKHLEKTYADEEVKQRKEKEFAETGLIYVAADCYVSLMDFEPAFVMKSYIDEHPVEDILNSEFIDKLRKDAFDDESIESLCHKIIKDQTEEYIKEKSDWFEDNKRYCNFAFNQSAWGADQILGNGCCWAISVDWCKRLIELGDAPLPKTYEEFNPVKKEIGVDRDGSAESSGVTRKMRFAQAFLSVTRGTHSFEVIAKQFGLYCNPVDGGKGSFATILGKFMQRLHKMEGDDLHIFKDQSHVFVLTGAGSTTIGHAMILQIDPQKNLYRFGDPNSGMYTYTDPARFVDEIGTYMNRIYPDFARFGIESVSKKK